MNLISMATFLTLVGVVFGCYPCSKNPDTKPTKFQSHVNCGWVYHVSLNKTLSWQAAQSECRQFGWELTSIDHVDEFEYLRWLISEAGVTTSGPFWTSGNDIDKEGSFVWSSNCENLKSFYPTGNPQPDNGSGIEDCVSLRQFSQNGGYVMNDEDCTTQFSFICKEKLNK